LTWKSKYNALLVQYNALNAQLTDTQAKLSDCQTRSAAKSDTIVALEAKVADLQKQLADCQASNPNEHVLRSTDGVSIQQKLNQLAAGDVLRLVGNFNLTQELHFPFDNMTLRCNPGEAKITATQAMADMIGAKRGPGTGRKNITLENLELNGAQVATNCISGWIGMFNKSVKAYGGKMTGFHINGEGIGRDFGIVNEDCDFSNNGSAAEVGHGAAGTKVFNVHGITYRRCKANNNTGNGFWSDHSCGRVEYFDCESVGNSVRGYFREKCGRHGNPYPKDFVYGMYVPDFERLGGVVIYDGMLTIQGGRCQNNGSEGVLVVASPHARISGVTFGGNGGGNAIIVRNDPNRMYPIAATKTPPTQPGWMVEDIVVNWLSCVSNGDKLSVQSNVPAGKYQIT